jgi:hypothetical protein
MIVLPGPAFIVIPAGLAILGIEFAFARRWLRRLRETGSQVFGGTLFRWFRKQPKNTEVLVIEHPPQEDRKHGYKDGAGFKRHAVPPYACGHVVLNRARAATSNSKAGYLRTR